MKDALLIFLIALAAYSLTAGGHLYSPDEELLYRMTESLATDGDLAIEPIAAGFATRRGGDGRQYAQYGVGQPILAIPFYAAGRVMAGWRDDATWRRIYGISEDIAPEAPDDPRLLNFSPYDARNIAPRFACSFYNIFVAAALAALLFLILFELTGHRGAALLATALYAFGSMAWPHSRPFFSETTAALFGALACYALLRCERGPLIPWAAAAGFSIGFIALVHLKAVVLWPGLGVLVLTRLHATAFRVGKVWPARAAFLIPPFLCLVTLLGLNLLHFGGPFETGYSDQPEGVAFDTPLLAGLHGFLFTPGKGLFFFSPALALGLLGWPAMARRLKLETLAVALLVAIPVLVMSKWRNWPGGWCWGPRHIFYMHVFLAIPAAFWLAEHWTAARRIAASAALVIGVGVQLLGCSQDFILYHRVFFLGMRPDTLQISPQINFARVPYDAYDGAMFEQRFQLRAIPPEGGEPVPVRPQYAPAPISSSIYYPPHTVWARYPVMWSELDLIDNLWVRVMRD